MATLALAASGCTERATFGDGGLGGDSARCAEVIDGPPYSEELAITAAYADSLHEMVACGALTVSLCDGVVSGMFEALLESRPDGTPEGWTWNGNGAYTTGADGVSMTTRFYAAEDIGPLRAGEPIPHDLFLVENFLVGPVVDVDLLGTTTTVSFVATGPLVELLGYGPQPPNPLELTLEDLYALETKLGALEFESDVQVHDLRPEATVRFHVVTERMSAGQLLYGASLPFLILDVEAESARTSQWLVTEEWDISFVDQGLLGVTRYRVVGGSFDYHGQASFDRSPYAVTNLSCE